MDTFAKALADLGPWVWIMIGVLMFVLETVVPGLHFIWFGLAALIAGIAAFAGLASVPMQVAIFGAASLAMILAVRTVFGSRQMHEPEAADLNERGRQYVGRIVTVEDDISGGRGRIRVGDTLWLAKGPDTPKGGRVRITGVDGTVLVVEAA